MKIGYSVIFENEIDDFENNLNENHQIELNLRTSPQKAFSKRFEIENVVLMVKKWGLNTLQLIII